ncbi:MAG TPA: glycoside hydrolase family 18 protein, partial [Acidimicrobiales bacterium]|nr:glycoside hydrolase family 18 protein [Acidimicrobiales bacterium]
LHQVDPHWQVTMDTYASSAADGQGFYDIGALAQVVDGFFVMQYSPNLSGSPEATSPLTSPLFSDLTTVREYTAAVPAAKVILGAPFYGLDWPTNGDTLAAAATGPVADLSYGQIAGAGHPAYWDPVTDSAWTAYQVGAQWHETFYDDPTSLYQIAQLAGQSGLGGVGIWALGMDGNDPAMVSALDGNPPAITYAPSPGTPPATPTAPPVASTPTTTTTPSTVPPGPSTPGSPTTGSTTTTAPPVASTPTTTTTPTTAVGGGPTVGGTTPTTLPSYLYQGTWEGQPVTLEEQPAVPPSVLTEAGAKKIGTLTGFSTTDPERVCLGTAPGLAVWQLPAAASPSTTTTTTPGEGPQYTVVATEPTDCVSTSFTFNPAAGSWSPATVVISATGPSAT